MIDNEKAATFIGWESYTCDDGHCDFCGSRALPHHPAKAPDMSDPRNYMEALEAVAASNKFWGVFVKLDMTCVPECHFEYFAMPVRPSQRDRDISREGKTIAEAVVKALAALYDAENTND